MRLRAPFAPLLLAAALALPLAPAAAQDPRPPAPAPDTILAPRDTIPRGQRDTAQVSIPPEAVRADTIPEAIVGDTAQRDTAQADTTLPAPLFPEYPRPAARGFSDGAWYWSRADLEYVHGMSLAELLIDRVPGLVVTRSGSFGRPMAVSPFAAGGGRFRVFLDGWELRPLNGSVPDLQQIPLVNLESVRIQRSLTELRIDLTSFRLSDARPFARIEGADGDYDSRILRGFFTRPIGSRLLPEVGLDLVETDGFRRAEPFSGTHLVARVSYAFSPTAGVQLEYRNSAVDINQRNETTAAGRPTEVFDRNELVLRGRARLLGNLWVDAQVGRSRLEPAGEDTVTRSAESTQALARATLEAGFGTLAGGVRLHTGGGEGWDADASEVFGRIDFTPAPLLSAWGEARVGELGGVSGFEAEGGARLGLGPFTLFGSVAAGNRGVQFVRDTAVERQTVGGVIGLPGAAPVDTVTLSAFRTVDASLTGLRAGGELSRGAFTLGAAYVLQDVSQIAPYGVEFDRGFVPVEGDAASAVEAYASFPLYFRSLRVDGWYLRFLGDATRPYQPTQLGHAAVTFRRTYYGGNLEPTFRVEAVARDEALARNRATGERDVLTQQYALFNLYLQVRIIDIRVFWRFENLANRRAAFDVPGTVLPGGRALFGVRWFFRN